MKKVVMATLCCLWPIVVTATGVTDEAPSAQIGSIEIYADEIEMVTPLEFHAKGNVIISGRGDEIRANTAIITQDRHMVTIEAEEFSSSYSQ